MESKEIKKVIGARVAQERRRVGLSLPKFAAALAAAVKSDEPVSGEAIRRYEKGLDLPRPEIRAALAAFSGKPEAYFVLAEEPSKAQSVIDNQGQLRQLNPREEQVLELLKELYPEQQRDLIIRLHQEVAYAKFLRTHAVKNFRPISDKQMLAILNRGAGLPPKKRTRKKPKPSQKTPGRPAGTERDDYPDNWNE